MLRLFFKIDRTYVALSQLESKTVNIYHYHDYDLSNDHERTHRHYESIQMLARVHRHKPTTNQNKWLRSSHRHVCASTITKKHTCHYEDGENVEAT